MEFIDCGNSEMESQIDKTTRPANSFKSFSRASVKIDAPLGSSTTVHHQVLCRSRRQIETSAPAKAKGRTPSESSLPPPDPSEQCVVDSGIWEDFS